MEGDFLSAIQITRLYYIGEAEGNRNGLPEDPDALRETVGTKMRELMAASAGYAFSQDRLTDDTHITLDNRGVDRTSMFENLVSTCVRACMALGDLDFVFEDLFQHYDDSGISRIYLTQLEPFILDGSVSQVPPRITQRIIAMHAEDGHPDLVEQVIWHIDPLCLDINQAISLCQVHHLYDALIYVYTRSLQDYVSPIVILIGLIRKVQRFRRDRTHRSSAAEISEQEAAIEPYVINAYKIYPYLSDVLTGMTYPSEEPLSNEEASRAKQDIYTFLFFGRSSVWPEGEGGELVLTSDEEGGVEPTYPYLRLLLRFDAESLLNSLDLAFEDSYLTDEPRGVSRLVIIKVLLDILSSSDLAPADTMFINIFIARNVPKYVQFIQLSPSALHDILISLAEYPDEGTREDRQLAAEFLLSVYTPHEGERLQQIFEEAGFYRILRSWHRQERMWKPLIFAYLRDPELRASEVFPAVEDVLKESSRPVGTISSELHDTLFDALPDLLHSSVTSTALVIDKFAPDLHQKAIDLLGEGSSPQRFSYLRHLFGLPSLNDELSDGWRAVTPSPTTPQPLRLLYVSLQCELDRPNVITALRQFPVDFFEWSDVARVCEVREVYEAVVWSLGRKGDNEGALKRANFIHRDLTAEIIGNWDIEESRNEVVRRLDSMVAVSQQAVRICLHYSRLPDLPAALNVQDMWFELLKSQVECVQAVSANITLQGPPATQADENKLPMQEDALTRLRGLVQDTFSSLVSVSSSQRISFPRLFKRLVDSATQTSRETHYNEFRTILTGMMESYRSDGDILLITKQILDRDVFDVVEELTKVRLRGYKLEREATCSSCGKGLLSTAGGAPPAGGLKLSPSGVAYHTSCFQNITV
jgi:vacuolar protein sorting-associated protein 8